MKGMLKKLLLILGPGIVFASMAIGETHLVLQAYAGALYGMALLWLLVLVHLFYYPIYEYGARYAVATGETLIDGYWRLRFRKPLFWYFIFFLMITPALILGSLCGLTGSVLSAMFPVFHPSIDFDMYSTLIFLVTVSIIVANKYKVIERISKILMLILMLLTIFAFFLCPPKPTDFFSGLIPSIPPVIGVWVVVVAILRVPSDPAASIFISEWAKEKRKEWGEKPAQLKKSLRMSLIDMRISFSLSFFVAAVFMALGAVIFKPKGIVPEDIDIAFKLSELYTSIFGQWIFYFFLVGAFAAFWGGYVSVMDGVSRLFKNVIQRLFEPKEVTTNRIGKMYIILAAGAGLLMTTVLERPVVLLLFAVSMALIYYPLVIALNTYCVTKMVDKEFRPGPINVTLAILGFLLSMTGLVLLILVKVLKVLQ